MLIYGLKNCDTCRKAIKALPDAQLVDVRKDGVPADVLAGIPARIIDIVGIGVRASTLDTSKAVLGYAIDQGTAAQARQDRALLDVYLGELVT